ncbi:MAG: STAS domain-containing protein, partial [Opitutae bacterium]|nr:STAS domain-containing protein [Opitutae bacterium]
MDSSKGDLKSISPGDVLAGVTVALVVIPQSIAYADLAGMPPYTGLLAAALPAITASFFSSSPYLQTGPVALTSILSFGVLSQLAAPSSAHYISLAASLALLVGVFRVLIGVFRFGQIAYLISRPVLLGFTTAAALLIILSQLPKSLGIDIGDRSVVNGAFFCISQPQNWFMPAVLVAALSIAIITVGRCIHKLFPGIALAVVLGLLASTSFSYGGTTVGDIPSILPRLSLHIPWPSLPSIALSAFVIALVGFAEPASIARSYSTLDKIPWNANREFISQGIANITAGAVGGFPVGGSFSRTSINRLAGARSRFSGLVTGCTVLAFAPFTNILSNLPTAVLGGIVIAAVLNLISIKELWHLKSYSMPQACIGWLTFFACFLLAPRIDIAILAGIGIAVAHHLRREQRLVIESWVYDNSVHIKPKGVLWFGSIANFETELQHLLNRHREAKKVILHLEGLGRIDLSAAVSLWSIVNTAKESGIEVSIENVPPMAKAWSKRL